MIVRLLLEPRGLADDPRRAARSAARARAAERLDLERGDRRFGLVAYGDVDEEILELAAVLIGKQPEAGEEFDVEEPR